MRVCVRPVRYTGNATIDKKKNSSAARADQIALWTPIKLASAAAA